MKHSHYYRTFAGRKLDFYKIAELFGPWHPAQEHALKKLMFAGVRGSKNLKQDIQEAVESIARWYEMLEEDENPAVALGEANENQDLAEQVTEREREVLEEHSTQDQPSPEFSEDDLEEIRQQSIRQRQSQFRSEGAKIPVKRSTPHIRTPMPPKPTKRAPRASRAPQKASLKRAKPQQDNHRGDLQRILAQRRAQVYDK
jgi:hypothetical protein